VPTLASRTQDAVAGFHRTRSKNRSEAHREARRKRQETTTSRLLGWLQAYPASSAQELASAFSLHPATIYRHLGRLLAVGWIQRLTGYGGDARFLLTPGGTARLAQVLHQDADQLARTWQGFQEFSSRDLVMETPLRFLGFSNLLRKRAAC